MQQQAIHTHKNPFSAETEQRIVLLKLVCSSYAMVFIVSLISKSHGHVAMSLIVSLWCLVAFYFQQAVKGINAHCLVELIIALIFAFDAIFKLIYPVSNFHSLTHALQAWGFLLATGFFVCDEHFQYLKHRRKKMCN